MQDFTDPQRRKRTVPEVGVGGHSRAPPCTAHTQGGRCGSSNVMGGCPRRRRSRQSIAALFRRRVLWGTLSPTVRADRAALRDYFVTAFKVLPGLKVAFGDQLIRLYGDTAVNTGYYTFSHIGRRDQDFPGALQLHLCQARRQLAHCGPSFVRDAAGPEIALRG